MSDQFPKGIKVCGRYFANDDCHKELLDEWE